MCWLTAQVLWRNYHSWLRTNLRFSSTPITRLSAWFIIQLHKLILPEKAHNSARATLPWSSFPTLCSQSRSQSFSRTFVSLTSAAMFTYSLRGLPASCQKHVSPIYSHTSPERDTASRNWSTYCSPSSSRKAITFICIHSGDVTMNLLTSFLEAHPYLTMMTMPSWKLLATSASRGVWNQTWAATTPVVSKEWTKLETKGRKQVLKVNNEAYYRPIAKEGVQTGLARDPELARQLYECIEKQLRGRGYWIVHVRKSKSQKWAANSFFVGRKSALND